MHLQVAVVLDEAELAEFVWQRNRVLEKSGFAALPGSKTGEPGLARACAELLMAPVAPKA